MRLDEQPDFFLDLMLREPARACCAGDNLI
jgi:hypothetical protein